MGKFSISLFNTKSNRSTGGGEYKNLISQSLFQTNLEHFGFAPKEIFFKFFVAEKKFFRFPQLFAKKKYKLLSLKT